VTTRDAQAPTVPHAQPEDLRPTAALARFALGDGSRPSRAGVTLSRHLAFLPNEALALDLTDPEQRDFGDFELVEQLGQGGMGVVYRARQKSLDREVAVKLLAAGPWASADFIERFRREAQSAARMTHPNIVPIFEIGQFEEMNFFAMRLVRGPSLAAVLARSGPLDPPAAARLLRTIAEALDYAHRLGVLHLDLKPGNVLIDDEGEPQVADFGLARRIDETLAAETEEISGTPSYMAPEQAQLRRHTLSPATDIYGLGAILYECLTGRPPFLAATVQETLRRVVEQEPERPREARRDVPADLEAICLKCLAMEPKARYPCARALADDLGRFVEGRAVSVRPLHAAQRIARWARREPRLAALALLLALSLVAGLGATTAMWQRALRGEHAALVQAWSQRLTSGRLREESGRGYAALPDHLASLAEQEAAGDTARAARQRLRLGLTLGAYPQLIDAIDTGHELYSTALSPDGRHVATGAWDGHVGVHDTATGEPVWSAVVDDERGDLFGLKQVRYTRDGRYVLATRAWGLREIAPANVMMHRFDAATGAPAPIEAHVPDARAVSYGDDGRYAMITDAGGNARLWDAEAWRPVSAALPVPSPTGFLVAPDGRYVLAVGVPEPGVHRLERATLAIAQRFVSDAPVPPDAHWARDPSRHWSAWTISADGAQIALGHRSGEIVLIDAVSGASRTLLPGANGDVWWLAFGADGRALVAAGFDGTVRGWNLPDGTRRGVVRQLDVQVRNVAFDAASGWLGVATCCDWGLLQAGPDGLPPEGSWMWWRAPRSERARATHSFGVALHPASGLVATTQTNDSRLRLWRLAATPVRPYGGAPGLEYELRFDGRHLVEVDGTRVRVRAVRGDAPVSAWFEHDAPIGYAQLALDGATLVVASGARVHVRDFHTGLERYAALELASLPTLLEIAPDASTLLVGWMDENPATARADLAVALVALADGRTLQQARLAGDQLVADVRFAPDGRDVLLLTARGEVVRFTRDDPTLRVEAVDAVALDRAAHGTTRFAIAAVAGVEAQIVHGEAQVVRYGATGAEAPPEPLGTQSIGVALSPDGDWTAAVQPYAWTIRLRSRSGAQHTVRFDAAAAVPMRTVRFSPDGDVLAVGLRPDGIALIEPQTGQFYAPPLRAPGIAVEALAFAPDGRAVVGRGRAGRWMYWPLRAETRAVDALHAAVETLAPADVEPRRDRAAWRRRLRAADPGATAQTVADERPATARCATVPPPRAAGLPPAQLDLSRGLQGLERPYVQAMAGFHRTLCGLPAGPARLLGTDFDLRGALAAPAGLGTERRIARVELARAVIGRLELLVASGPQIPDVAPGRSLIDVVLHYADGTRATLPLRRGEELEGCCRPLRDGRPQLAWYAPSDHSFVEPILVFGTLYRARLVNPYPDRPLAALELVDRHKGQFVFAVTVDPGAQSPPGSAARAD
jgi:WD40 repeat protein